MRVSPRWRSSKPLPTRPAIESKIVMTMQSQTLHEHSGSVPSPADLTLGPGAIFRFSEVWYGGMSLRFVRQKRCCPLCRAAYLQAMNFCPADGSTLVSFPQDPLIGTTLSERYQIQSVLYEGTMGRVYRGCDSHGGGVAVHVLYGEFAAVERVRSRFLDMAAKSESIVHPNVVAVVGFGEAMSGMPYLATPLLQGRSLAELIDQEAPLPLAKACALFRGVCAGVAEIHRHGIVHRDLRPTSIVVEAGSKEDVPKILNLWKPLVKSSARPSHSRRADDKAETTAYMAPERFYSTTATDHRVDLFSLGVMFYKMLTGVLPYEESLHRRAFSHIVPPRMGARVPGLPVHLPAEAIALRLLQPGPADRYKDADHLIAALARLA